MKILNEAQKNAQYRVRLKRQLRILGVQFSNEAATVDLEMLTKANQKEGTVTFARNGGQNAGFTVKVEKVDREYLNEVHNGYSFVTETIKSVSYLFDGLYHGPECFLLHS